MPSCHDLHKSVASPLYTEAKNANNFTKNALKTRNSLCLRISLRFKEIGYLF